MATVYLPPVVVLFLLLMLINNPHEVRCESFGTEVDERLGVAYEFKIHIDPGKEECFFQSVNPHSSLYVAFQVSFCPDVHYVDWHQVMLCYIIKIPEMTHQNVTCVHSICSVDVHTFYIM